MGRDEFKRRIGGLSWAESDEARLETLRGRLQEKTPFERAKALSATKSFLDKLIAGIKSKTEMLSAGSFNRFQALKTTMAVKRNAANLAANQLFSDMAQLDGVGSAVWRELWRAAKAYAAEKAYPGKIYPHDDPEMRCVLCQQVLDDDGRKRMKAFEDFVKGKAQKELDDAISANNAFLASLPVAEDAETFDKTLMSAGIVEEGEKKLLVSFNDSVGERRTAFDACVSEVELSKLVDVGDWIEKATLRSCELSKQCEALMSDAQSGVEGRERLKTEIRELEARKWLVENLTTLKWRHAYVRLNAEIEKAKKLLSTAKLSSKKSELTGRIVTEAYIARFESELKTLSGGRIKVSLAKSRVAKGHVLHRISLNVEHAVRVRDILSEGECRVVSLAAFLADSEGNRVSAPFVFDDPISSLDQPYEEAVAKRLIELAKTRQVIVFTHRLSMIGTILHFTKREKVEKVGVSCEAIREFNGETGVIAEIPISTADIKSVLKRLRVDRIPRCKALLNSGKIDEYETELKGLCSDFRIVVERSVEADLLFGIVERYARPVSTMKIPYLAKLKESDWRLLDSLMTKYSGFEHAQPQDAPVQLPTLEVVEADIKTLEAWRKAYNPSN